MSGPLWAILTMVWSVNFFCAKMEIFPRSCFAEGQTVSYHPTHSVLFFYHPDSGWHVTSGSQGFPLDEFARAGARAWVRGCEKHNSDVDWRTHRAFKWEQPGNRSLEKSSRPKSLVHMCINCKYRSDDPNDSGALLKCSSCNLSMLKQNMLTQIKTNMFIIRETGESAERYLCPMKVLDSLFDKLSTVKVCNIADKEVAKLPLQMIIETLLRLEKVSFVVSSNEKVVQLMGNA